MEDPKIAIRQHDGEKRTSRRGIAGGLARTPHKSLVGGRIRTTINTKIALGLHDRGVELIVRYQVIPVVEYLVISERRTYSGQIERTSEGGIISACHL